MAKKRKFKRQCFWYKKLGTKWRKPKGRHSKLRHEKNGRWIVPKVGYGRPDSERGKIMVKGIMMMPVAVSNVKGLELINPKEDAVIIPSAVGIKKSNEIIAAAEKMGIKIANRKAVKAKKLVKNAEKKAEEKVKQ